MTASAVASFFKYFPPSRGIAESHRAGIEISHIPNIGNNPDQFGFVELEGRHGGPRNSIQNSIPYVSIGRNSLKLPGTQVDARNQIAVFAMTGRTLTGIDS